MFSEVRRAVGLGYCGFHCNYPEDHDQSAHFTMCTDGGGGSYYSQTPQYRHSRDCRWKTVVVRKRREFGEFIMFDFLLIKTVLSLIYITRICASLGLRMKFKTLCYPVI